MTLASVPGNAEIIVNDGNVEINGRIGAGARVTVNNGSITVKDHVEDGAHIYQHGEGNVCLDAHLFNDGRIVADGDILINGAIGRNGYVESNQGNVEIKGKPFGFNTTHTVLADAVVKAAGKAEVTGDIAKGAVIVSDNQKDCDNAAHPHAAREEQRRAAEASAGRSR